MEQITVVKIGGNIIDIPDRLQAFLQQFSALKGPKILIHGGGKIATETGKRLGIEPNYIDGRRITDADTLELVTMVYGGLVNKTIVTKLQNAGTNAIGLTGADGQLIIAKKRLVAAIDYGYVGDIINDGINTHLLTTLLDGGLTPVIAPLSYEKNGTLLNTNADTIGNEIARTLSANMDVSLVYCFEQKGVLQSPDDPFSIIPKIAKADFGQLKSQGIVSGGMIPKLENAFNAISHGVKRVIIGQAEDLEALLAGTKGTAIT